MTPGQVAILSGQIGPNKHEGSVTDLLTLARMSVASG